jgi:hypothetical protein
MHDGDGDMKENEQRKNEVDHDEDNITREELLKKERDSFAVAEQLLKKDQVKLVFFLFI